MTQPWDLVFHWRKLLARLYWPAVTDARRRASIRVPRHPLAVRNWKRGQCTIAWYGAPGRRRKRRTPP